MPKDVTMMRDLGLQGRLCCSLNNIFSLKVISFILVVSQEASLYTVKAIAILDNDGERVVAKV